MKNSTYIKGRRALIAAALEKGVTLEEMRSEIQVAIRTGLANPDPAVQAQWRKMSRSGKTPTPEEVVIYLSKRANS